MLPGENRNTIEDIRQRHARQEVWGAIAGVAQSCYTFGCVTQWGQPTTLSPRKIFLILAEITLVVHVRLHCAIGVQWMKKSSVHPFRECTCRTTVAGHYMWASGTPFVLEQTKDMVFS